MCKYVCACIVCLKEREGMKVREKRSRGEYIDRFVDETIVFELSGWTQTLPLTVCDFHLVCLCLFVFFCPVNSTMSLSLSQFLSLSFSFSQDLSLFAVMFISSLIAYLLLQPCTYTELTFWPFSIGAVHIMIACIICWRQMCRPHQDDSLLTALINAGELSDQIEEIIEITHLHNTPYVFKKWYRFKMY